MFGLAPVLRRVYAHLYVQVVRTLFGFLPDTPKHSRCKSEQDANSLKTKPITIPAQTRRRIGGKPFCGTVKHS
jgi:hypothetical protein